MAMARPALPPVEWRSSAFREAQTRYAPPRRALKVSASLVTILAAGGAAAFLLTTRPDSDVQTPPPSSAPVSPPAAVPSAAPTQEAMLPETAFVLFPPVVPATASEPKPAIAPSPRQNAGVMTRTATSPGPRSTPVAPPVPPPVTADSASEAFAESFPLPEPADRSAGGETPPPPAELATAEFGQAAQLGPEAAPSLSPPPPEAAAAPDISTTEAALPAPAVPLAAEPVAQAATEPPLAPLETPAPDIVLAPLAAAEPQREAVFPPPPPPAQRLSLPEQASPVPAPPAAAPSPPAPASVVPSAPVRLARVEQSYTEIFPSLVVGTRTLGAVTLRDYGNGFATVHLGALLGLFKLRMPEAEYARLAAAPAAGTFVGIDELRAAGLAVVFDPRKGQLAIALDPLPPGAPPR